MYYKMDKTSTTPMPPEAEVVREENMQGIANVNSSVNGGRHNEVNDYSVDLNFISLHLNMLASTGSIIVIVLIILLFSRWALKGGMGKMWDVCLGLCQCCSKGQASAPDLECQEVSHSPEPGPSSQPTRVSNPGEDSWESTEGPYQGPGP